MCTARGRSCYHFRPQATHNHSAMFHGPLRTKSHNLAISRMSEQRQKNAFDSRRQARALIRYVVLARLLQTVSWRESADDIVSAS